MSATDAVAFIDRVEKDDGFAAELESMRKDPAAALERVHAAGFDATHEEIFEAFADRYGAALTLEQLDQIAAGTDPGTIAVDVTASVTAAVALGLCAAAAAGV